MESSFTFLRVRGIEIGANWSWLIVFALIAWSLGAQLFPRTYPGLSQETYLVMGVVAAIVFFVSILLHELGHAFQAIRDGMEIDGITLWLFGGVARFKGMFPSAGAEFRIAIAGPIVSVLLAIGFWGLTLAGNSWGLPDVAVGVTDYLARINAIVVGFNLVPALPLDGGRVLRSWLWHRQQSFTAATRSAAKAARAFAWLLIAVGVLGFITGAGIGGIWFAFLGWFLLQAAQAEASYAVLRQGLAGVRVRDLMTSSPAVVRPEVSVEDFVEEATRMRRHSTYPVVSGDDLVGMVSIRQAGEVDPSERPMTRIQDVMAGREEVPILDPDQEVFEAVTAMQGEGRRAVVMDGGRVAGILSPSDVAKALEYAQIRGKGPDEGAERGPGVLVWIVVGGIILAAAGFLYRPPVAVISPGEAIAVDEDITISGIDVDEVNGDYLLTSVRLAQPNGLSLALAWVQGDRILPLSAVVPRGQDPEEFVEQQMELFTQSQEVAAAAAARAVGMDVRVTGEGARVVGVVGGAPAADVLEEGDVIVAVDGESVEVAQDLSAAIRARPAGTRFDLTILRDGQEQQVSVISRGLGQVAEGFVGIGISIETVEFDVELPFEVSFAEREIGGPSAGLAYALVIADMLDPGDDAAGRVIAATGTIDTDGSVGPVGGVSAKAEAALDQGAELFLVPRDEIEQARGAGLQVRGVSTLEETLRLLRRTG